MILFWYHIHLHQRCFKDNATGTIWQAHVPSSVGVVIKRPRWETHTTSMAQTNTQYSSDLCVIEKQCTQSLVDERMSLRRREWVWEKTDFCWHGLKPVTPFINQEHSHTKMYLLKKLWILLFDDIFLFVKEYLKVPFSTLLYFFLLNSSYNVNQGFLLQNNHNGTTVPLEMKNVSFFHFETQKELLGIMSKLFSRKNQKRSGRLAQ